MINKLRLWYLNFIENPCFDGAGTSSHEFKLHIDFIKILLGTFIFVFGVGYFMGHPGNLKALYIQTTEQGVPLRPHDYSGQRNPVELQEFSALVVRQTFDLDSFGMYKNYRNQINRVNSLYYRLSWRSLNLSEQEKATGFVNDGERNYRLEGQELTAMLVRSRIIRHLMNSEVKFWVDARPENVQLLSTQVCVSDDCYYPTRQWDVKIKTNLYMMNFSDMKRISSLPMEVHLRLISANPMVSPKHRLMVDRIATKIGVKQ